MFKFYEPKKHSFNPNKTKWKLRLRNRVTGQEKKVIITSNSLERATSAALQGLPADWYVEALL